MYDIVGKEYYYAAISAARKMRGVFSLQRDIKDDTIVETVSVSGYLVAFSISNETLNHTRYMTRIKVKE